MPLLLMAGVLILALGVAGGMAVQSFLSKRGDGGASGPGALSAERLRVPDRPFTREEMSDWSERVDKELRILKVATPGSIRVLADDPKSVHVVEIACTADKFASDEVEILKKWVQDGGIVWTDTDAVSLFGIQHRRAPVSRVPGALVVSPEWVAASPPEVCPILKGCTQVVTGTQGYVLTNLSAKGVIPLLSAKNNNVCTWSLVPYGRGWVSDVKKLTPDQYDGARFWLHFRMFCLRWPIPG